MLGKLDLQHREVTVIGAGIAGLLAAYRLDRAGFEVTVLEAEPRVGGLISTRKTEHGLVETAAHSLLASGAVRDLFRELSLRPVEVRRESKARYIYRRGELRRMPLSALEIAGLLGRAACVRAPAGGDSGRSLAEWGKVHLGQAALDYLLAPFLVGIHGATPEELDVQAAFPGLDLPGGKTLFSTLWSRKPRDSGGKSRMVTLEGGMGSLVDALGEHLHRRLGSRLRIGVAVDRLPLARNAILAVPAPVASRLLRGIYPRTASALEQVRYAPLITCTVFVRDDRHRAPRGVGVLFPPKENRPLLGVLFNSSCFPGRLAEANSIPERKVSSYTVMLGGTLRPEVLERSDEEIRTTIENEFRILFGLAGAVEHVAISRWRDAIPIYSRDLRTAWGVAQTELASRPGLVLFGNYSGKVSLRGMIEESRRITS